MTVKSSISLSDTQHAFAKALVEAGRFSSVSAVVQQGIDLLRQQEEDAQADRAALRALLEVRASGPFLSGTELRNRVAADRARPPE